MWTTSFFATVVGFAAMVYDHILTAETEMRVVWANRNAGVLHKLAFGISRYMPEVVIGYTVYVFSGTARDLNDVSCRAFIWLFGATAVLFAAISHSVLVLRIYNLWDQRKSVARILMALFILGILATIVIGIFCQLQLKPIFLQTFAICTVKVKPKILSVLFIVQSLFDVVIVFIAVWNALERPHRNTGDMISSLQKDGLVLLCILFAVRTSYLIVSFVGNAGQTFAMVSTGWALASILTARLNLRIDGLALKRGQLVISGWDEED
ncbi:hypothetical protein C8J57DRAFT_1314694 [Mycena rebaudengoi]|nr:hypothetical protein C8J57DRAFT_1314694 [Mycena rebaudengoi]